MLWKAVNLWRQSFTGKSGSLRAGLEALQLGSTSSPLCFFGWVSLCPVLVWVTTCYGVEVRGQTWPLVLDFYLLWGRLSCCPSLHTPCKQAHKLLVTLSPDHLLVRACLKDTHSLVWPTLKWVMGIQTQVIRLDVSQVLFPTLWLWRQCNQVPYTPIAHFSCHGGLYPLKL